MPTFNFTSGDILNSDLRDNTSTTYRIITTRGALLGRRVTSLMLLGNGSNETVAAIHWRDSKFEIGGVQRNWFDLKYNPSGLLNELVLHSSAEKDF